ncbi:MAG: hypothetical protein BWY09_01213 [Candidatus Hydrogenedentes bacterium ADurb.Bin179]|nr:MAG: hypothetical protein BWY09_01213 [Candidatus Hydrogenedentes bacterium ADurb.Bin179]
MVMGGDKAAFAHDTKLVLPDKMVHGNETQFVGSQQQVLEIIPPGKDEQGPGVFQQSVGLSHPLQGKGAIFGGANFRIPLQHAPGNAVVIGAL